MRPKKARLVKTKNGKEPKGDGWFVLNVADSVWYGNQKFGQATMFEAGDRFPQIGINIHVLQPGQPACHYHAESEQEDFLVLSGECFVIINGKTVSLKAWDFVHCPPWTDHVFVGAGRGPCAILMVGARSRKAKLNYPRSPVALKHGAGVKKTTQNPRVSYADTPRWSHARQTWPLRSGPKKRLRG